MKKLYFLIIVVLIMFNFTILNNKTKAETIVKNNIGIDIKGAVNNPGYYNLEEGSTVYDQTTPNMIQRISGIFERNALISKGI